MARIFEAVQRGHLLACLMFILSLASVAEGLTVVWPTPNPGFANGVPWSELLQATASGNPESGGFGCVRNSGTRFHEAVDLKPYLKRTRRGEATDPVYAAIDGTVVHLAPKSGQSAYGRYVVLESQVDGVTFYTLYAHMASIDAALRSGAQVKAGTVLGVMGRSASYGIPRDRAHLHFEIGLRAGDRFQSWYDVQDFGSPNFHGNYNGLNLFGADPMLFFDEYKAGRVPSVASFIKRLPTAYVLRVNMPEVPSYARRNPALLTAQPPPQGLQGWEIAFTCYGLAKQLTPITAASKVDMGKPGSVQLVAVNREEVARNTCRDTVRLRAGKPVMLQGAVDIVHLLFDKAR